LLQQDSLARLIGLARRRLKQAVGRRVAAHGLTPQQFWALVYLHQNDGPALTALAEHLRSDAPTTSRIVAGLVRRGLVRAVRDAHDRRRTFLKLTPPGHRLALVVQPIADEIREMVERGLDRSEAGELRRLLNKVIAALHRHETEGVAV
jgi:DNA-binding MarR family transcriptional regulator